MACDVCKKVGTDLVNLRTQYQTDDIKAVCDDCDHVINGQLRKIENMTARIRNDLLRLFIRQRKDSK